MNRKNIILCVTAIGVFLIIVSVALFFLYSGTGKPKDDIASDREYMLFSAVPSDAVSVLKFREFGEMTACMASENSAVGSFFTDRVSSGSMEAFLGKLSASSSLYRSLLSSPAVLSVHDIGDLVSLLVIDAGKAGAGPAAEADSLCAIASGCGLEAQYVDASEAASSRSPLRKRSLLLLSSSDILIQSSLRHLKSEVSVLDVPGFPESVEEAEGGAMLVLPSSGAGKISSEIFSAAYGNYAGFFRKYADCTAFSLKTCTSDSFYMTGKSWSEGGADDFMNVFAGLRPSAPEIASVLPSYTVYAVSLPLSDVSAYCEAWRGFSETRSLSRTLESEFAALKKRTGTDPADWARAVGIREVAKAAYTVGGSLETVLLVRVSNMDSPLVFKENRGVTKENAGGKILDYAWKGYLSALFGPLFSLEDESLFLLHGNWLIVGSRTALDEYLGGRATDYLLSDYLADASVPDALSGRNTYFVSYHSLTEDDAFTASLFSKDFLPAVKASAEGVNFEPAFLCVEEGKSGMEVNFRLCRTVVTKSQAPTFERDASVEIPKGPFRVKNSGTGKMNLFYQQENLYLCLQEEGGKGLWGVPFSAPICGCAQTVDYYANGKLQILFASGTKLHLIDRLGRFVNPPFPVDLGKEILVGPDVYDFSGRRKYNVMILHKDNTIEMYNLQGRRPAEWKTITAAETIKGLPERIVVGGRTYWVVRTSMQTLIFGFYGGKPLTEFTGDRMIRPDSEVKAVGDGAVEVTCYDGRRHTVRLEV